MLESNTLKEELKLKFRSCEGEVKKIKAMRSASERIDSYTLIIRNVLSKSSLCYIDGELSFFNGIVYSPVQLKALQIIISNILPDLGVGASDARKIGEMPYSVIWERSYHSDTDKACFANAVYDISTGRIHSFSSDIICNYNLPYALAKTDRCPMWEKFLSEVMPDEDEQSCLQEFFGMCYVDRSKCSIEKMALLIGKGANGKSVIFDVMKNVIGIKWVSFLSPDQLLDSKQVVSVQGKKLNFSPDIKRSSAFDSGLKALSSSQDIQGWQLYQGNVVIKCPPLMFAFNEMPRFKDETDAFFRRLMPFTFDITIPPLKQDKELASKICKEELGGIFLWVMQGKRRLEKSSGKFTECRKIDNAVEIMKNKIRCEQNPTLNYIESIGYGISPAYTGQLFDKVTASSIYEGMGGKYSKAFITKELNMLKVRHDRGSEVRYYLYKHTDI